MKRLVTSLILLVFACSNICLHAQQNGNTFTCGTSTVRDYDGNVYNTVKIGRQCWMQENLKTRHYADGTAISNGGARDYYKGSSTQPYYYLPDDYYTYESMGYLYNWPAVMHSENSSKLIPSGVQGICPDGWHVPSDLEWKQLEYYVGSQKLYICSYLGQRDNEENIAKALAKNSYIWQTTNGDCCHVGYKPTGNNSTGFSAVPTSGNRISTDFWSSSQCDSKSAYVRSLSSYSPKVSRLNNPKSAANSVRCLRDDVPDGGGNASSSTCGTFAVRDYDGNVYNTVQIGQQCWMKENLRTKHYADGTEIQNKAICKYMEIIFDDNLYKHSNPFYLDFECSGIPLEKRGYMYNWPAVMHGANSSKLFPSGVQGICPDGWHVPSDLEWELMECYVGSQELYTCGHGEEYIAKALADSAGWDNSTYTGSVGYNQSANNATGFSAFPAGHLNSSGRRLYVGTFANFWSSSEDSHGNIWARGLNYDHGYMHRESYRGTDDFFYVRCLRDDVWDGRGSTSIVLPMETTNAPSSITAPSFTCGTSTVRDYDGNVYNTVQIGLQCWMKENLRTKRYANGKKIPSGDKGERSETQPYYYKHYKKDSGEKWGYWYNWPAVMHGANESKTDSSRVQGICPDGWHVPSDLEWEQLMCFLQCRTQYKNKIGDALAAPTLWFKKMQGKQYIGELVGGNNATGFSAVPAGYRGTSGFRGDQTEAYFWSSSPYYMILKYSSGDFHIKGYRGNKDYGCSVRCIRD